MDARRSNIFKELIKLGPLCSGKLSERSLLACASDDPVQQTKSRVRDDQIQRNAEAAKVACSPGFFDERA